MAVVLSFCGFYCLIITFTKEPKLQKMTYHFRFENPTNNNFRKTKFSCHLFQKMCRLLLDFYWEESTEVRDLSNFQQCFLILFTLNSLIASRTITLIPEVIILYLQTYQRVQNENSDSFYTKCFSLIRNVHVKVSLLPFII